MTLSIAKGEFVTLLGPSGCGKTTTLRMLGGFEKPTHGRILIDGVNVTDAAPNRRATNMVFQDYALFPHMTVAANIAFGPTVSRRDPSRVASDVDEMLAIVGLADKAKRLPSQLSGGQRQRVALARTLIQRPKLLLLDEPLGALDANLREQMRFELKDIQSRLGATFVIVTHDQEEALTMSDRIVVMNGGMVAQAGRPNELYDQPASAFVAEFLGAINLLEGVSAGSTQTVRVGSLALALDRVAPAGSSRIGIRPERIVLARPEHMVNVFDVRVKKRIFLGKAGRLTVQADSGPSLIVDQPIQDFTQVHDGASVRLHVPPDAIFLFP